MKHVRSKFLAVACCMTALIYSSCAQSDRIAGGTSETTNGFTVVAYNQNGHAIPFALVRIRPNNYLADTSNGKVTYNASSVIDTFADSSGRITINSLQPGEYAIEIQNRDRFRSLIRTVVKKDSLVDLGRTIVRREGGIEGAIDLSTLHSATRIYVLVRGMQRATIVNPTSGGFSITSLPQGDYTLRFVTAQPYYAPQEIQNIKVVSDSISAIGTLRLSPYTAWMFSKKITLNTSSTGAGISGDVHGFPVLVRLNAGNFDFTQAHAGGTDLRFSTSDSVPLSYEIARWDLGMQQAEIWVKTDTIHGNDSSQFINMFWGNPDTSVKSTFATAVFDTSNGFVGVWHLQGQGSQTVLDASMNRYNGVNIGAIDTSGVIGNAKWFNAKDSIVIPGLLHSLQTVSLSAWVNVDQLNSGFYGGDVVSIGDAILIRVDEKNYGVMGGFHINDTNYNDIASGKYIAKTGWHYIAFTYDGINHIQKLFIDGSLNKSEAFTNPINYSNVGANTTIGAHGNGKAKLNFKGAIDEVRVCKNVVSADWIKLSYKNQGANDKLVVFASTTN